MVADLWRCTGLTRLVLRGRMDDGGMSDGDEATPWRLPALEGARLPHLRALSLNGCLLTSGLVSDLVAAAPHLTGLALTQALPWREDGGGCPIEEMTSSLSRLTGLQELDFSGALEVSSLRRCVPSAACLRGRC